MESPDEKSELVADGNSDDEKVSSTDKSDDEWGDVGW